MTPLKRAIPLFDSEWACRCDGSIKLRMKYCTKFPVKLISFLSKYLVFQLDVSENKCVYDSNARVTKVSHFYVLCEYETCQRKQRVCKVSEHLHDEENASMRLWCFQDGILVNIRLFSDAPVSVLSRRTAVCCNQRISMHVAPVTPALASLTYYHIAFPISNFSLLIITTHLSQLHPSLRRNNRLN